MRKNGLKTILISSVTGALLLSTSVYTLATSGSGYETYKGAIKSTFLTKNVTVNTQFEVKDNGVAIVSGNSLNKIDKENKSSKTTVNINGVNKTIETSKNGANFVKNIDGKYYVTNMDGNEFRRDKREEFKENSSSAELAEMLTDTLVGDVKNQFVKDGDTISVNLQGAQIPELAKLAISAAVEKHNQVDKHKEMKNAMQDEDMKAAFDKMPKLSNIEIKSISMTGKVEGEVLRDNKFAIVLSGQDSAGTNHEINLNISTEFTNLGNTQADSIDITGKEVQTIDMFKDTMADNIA